MPNSDEGTLGHVLNARPPRWFNADLDPTRRVRLRAELEIITLFAGQIAEAKYLGRRPRYGMHSDNRQAVNLASYFVTGRDTLEAFLNFLFLSSRDLVSSRWSEIKWLAEELVHGKELTYEDVRGVIDRGYGLRESSNSQQQAPIRSKRPHLIHP